MTKLRVKSQKWLKGFHVFFAGMWVGGAVAFALLNFACKAGEGAGLYGINLSMKFVDDWIIIPGAMGSLLTGVLYTVFTRWGWFKHRWITVKWAITIFGILFGRQPLFLLFLCPLSNRGAGRNQWKNGK